MTDNVIDLANSGPFGLPLPMTEANTSLNMNAPATPYGTACLRSYEPESASIAWAIKIPKLKVTIVPMTATNILNSPYPL